jgi:hypothetical protein
MLVKKNFLLYVLIAIYASLLHSSSQQYMPARASTLAKRMNLALVGYVPPAMTKVAIQGNYAYVGAGPALMVFGVVDPDHPVRVAYMLLPAFVSDLAVSGGFAYVLTSDNRVLIIDITWPTAPAIRGIYVTAEGVADLCVEGSYLFLAVPAGLRIVDATDPANPQSIGFFPTQASPFPIIISGNYAYLLMRECTGEPAYCWYLFWVVDITDLTNPVLAGTMQTSDYGFQAMAADGQVLALVGSYYEYWLFNTALVFMDVSDPTSPQLIAAGYGGVGISASVAMSLGRVYFADREGVFRVIDISNPQNPNLVGYGVDPVEGMAVQGNFVYVAAGASGFAIEDISNPAQPVRRSLYSGTGHVLDVAEAAGILYVADGGVSGYFVGGGFYENIYGGLAVEDVSQPDAAQVIGKLSGPDDASYRVAVHGNYAYLAVGNCYSNDKLPAVCSRGLQSYDVTHPESPAAGGYADMLPSGYQNGSIDFSPGEVVISGTVALVADSGLEVIDVTQPLAPTKLTLYQFASTVQGVAMNGQYAFVAEQEGGLQVLDITYPSTPTLVSTYPLVNAMDVIVHEPYAYVANGDQGVMVLDVSDVHNISAVGEIDTPGTATSLALDEQYLYVADGDAGVRMIEVTLPENPVEVATYNTPGNAIGVDAGSGRVYVADDTGGLFILIPSWIQAYFPIISR